MPESDRASSAAICSRCGHPTEEHGDEVLPFAVCHHSDAKDVRIPGVLGALAHVVTPCWCPNLEVAA